MKDQISNTEAPYFKKARYTFIFGVLVLFVFKTIVRFSDSFLLSNFSSLVELIAFLCCSISLFYIIKSYIKKEETNWLRPTYLVILILINLLPIGLLIAIFTGNLRMH